MSGLAAWKSLMVCCDAAASSLMPSTPVLPAMAIPASASASAKP